MRLDCTILLVDDDASIRKLLRAVLDPLAELGATLLDAPDGATAVELARVHRPALVVLDVMMPGMNGFEVTEILRSDTAFENTKILMLTAMHGEFERQHGYIVGVDRYMAKPLDPDDLFDEAVRLLGVRLE